jgi:hypothetical protein
MRPDQFSRTVTSSPLSFERLGLFLGVEVCARITAINDATTPMLPPTTQWSTSLTHEEDEHAAEAVRAQLGRAGARALDLLHQVEEELTEQVAALASDIR